MLQVVQIQWKSNIDGKIVDTFKIHGLASVCVVVSHAVDGSPDNLKIAASEAHVFLAALGGCNRKVEVDVCDRLIALASMLWEHCRSKTFELVQPCSIVVERAAAFLSRAVLTDLADDAGGPDSPSLSQPAKDQALALLFEWLAAGGRVEKRALRGSVPQLAAGDGAGFFTAQRPPVQEFGELVARKACAEPSVLSAGLVRNILQAVQLLILSGPLAEADEKDISCLTFEEFRPDGSLMRFVDLDGWELSEDGQHASLLLKLLSGALEFRLLQGRGLDKEDFEMAFVEGNGLFVIIPLVQAPIAFAEHALRCLAALVQANAEHANDVVGLQTLHPLLGLPSPEVKPMPSYMEASLKNSEAARRYTAKILSRCAEHQVFLDVFNRAGEKCMRELVRLTIATRADGTTSLEAFHDMLCVLRAISQLQPGPLCQHAPAELMHLLVGSSRVMDSQPALYAAGILDCLRKDRKCEAALLPIIERAKGDKAYDVEDKLKGLSDRL